MATDIYVKKMGKSAILRACDGPSEEAVLKMKPNEVYRLKMTKPRNYKHLQKFMALIKAAFELIDNKNFKSEVALRKYITVQCGYYSRILTYKDGTALIEADSLAFDKMDQETFNDLYDQAVKVVIDLLPYDLSLEKLNEIVEFTK
jgi:hypothetical protein